MGCIRIADPYNRMRKKHTFCFPTWKEVAIMKLRCTFEMPANILTFILFYFLTKLGYGKAHKQAHTRHTVAHAGIYKHTKRILALVVLVPACYWFSQNTSK